MNLSLKGYNALICGSTSGIGKSSAQELASLGASITLFARNKQKLDDTLKTLKQDKGQVHKILIADFNNTAYLKQLIDSHIEEGNKYHILINNSGGPKGGPIEKADISEFLEAFNRHLICNHIISQALLPFMKKNAYGRIINIISTSVKQPIQGLGVSNTIRGAVASWSKTLSFEVASNGVTVNNILPGFTKTERLNSLISAKASSQNKPNKEIEESMKKQIPAARFGLPQETAKAVAFLSSPDSGYINGVNLAIDGGRLSTM